MEQKLSAADEKIISDLLPKKFNRQGYVWIGILLAICAVGVFAYYRQIRYGLVVTGLRDYALWGLYISNFVYFVAVSLVGSLIAAVLRLSGVKWATPITRISEIIAFAAIVFAGISIMLDMGRPDRFYNLFIYGRLQSPIIWDVLVIVTYLCFSFILIYIPLLPDIRLMLNHPEKNPKFLNKIYSFFGEFWHGTEEQKAIRNKAVGVLTIGIVPAAFCIISVDAWLFATTYRPGWDATSSEAYFISGAFLVGCGSVVVAMYVFRKYYGLEKYLTDSHFDKMGKILALLAVLYVYFNITEYMIPFFKLKNSEEAYLNSLLLGHFAPVFWFAILIGMIIPICILVFKKGRTPLPMFITGIMVVIGAWIKRYLIVPPTLLHPFLPMHNVPKNYTTYVPTWEEWAISMATIAGTLLIVTLFTRIFPIIPINELIEERHEKDNQ